MVRTLARSLTLLIITALAVTGCATPSSSPPPAPTVAAAEPAPQDRPPGYNPAAVASRGAKMLTDLPGLTPEQKQKIGAIYGRTAQEAATIRTQIADIKSSIFATLASKNYKSPEIEKLKNQIVKLDRKRLETMFTALADLQAVIGQGPDKEDIYRRLRDYENLDRPSRTALNE